MAGPVKVGRYLLFEAFAVGGTAQVHFGRLVGPVGFSRTFAFKRLHPHLVGDIDFSSMLLDEARLAARIRHPAVVPVFEVIQLPGELLLVMDYVPGASLARLSKLSITQSAPVPVPIAVAILCDVLAGLQAAHDAKNEAGQPLEIVHRDVTPQNVMVGTDGLSRMLDFGIAHAAERLQGTRTGEVKGKLEYLAPEQIRRTRVDRRTDVYAASVVLWELLAGRRLFDATRGDASDLDILRKITAGVDEPPSAHRSEISPELDAIALRGLSPDGAERFESAAALARALETAAERAPAGEVAAWMQEHARALLERQAARLAEIEAYVPDGREPVADRLPAGALDELLDGTTHRTQPSRPRPPSAITSSYTNPPDPEPDPEPEPEPDRNPDPEPDPEPFDPMRGIEEAETPIATPGLPPPAPVTRRVAARLEPPPPAPPSGKRLVVASIAGAAVLGSVFVAIALTRSCGRDAPAVVAVEPTVPAAAPAPTPEPPLVDPPPEPAIPVTAEPEPKPAPVATPLPGKPAAVRPSKPKPKPKPSCNPPYTIDAHGVRIPKRECF